MESQPAACHLLLRIRKAASGIEDVIEDRLVCSQARNQTVAAARVAAIPAVVSGHTQEDVVVWHCFERAADGPHVLVVIFLTGGEVLPKSVAAKASDRAADPQSVGKRC